VPGPLLHACENEVVLLETGGGAGAGGNITFTTNAKGTRPALPRHAARLAPPVAQLALPVAPYAGHLRARVVQCRQDRSGAPARVWPATTCRGGCSAASRASMRRCMHRTSARLGCQPPGLQAAAPCGCVHLPERARQHSHVGPTCGVMLA